MNWLALLGGRAERKGLRGRLKWATERKGLDNIPANQAYGKKKTAPSHGVLWKTKPRADKKAIPKGFPPVNSSKFSYYQS